MQLTLINNDTPGWSIPADLTIEQWRDFGARIKEAEGTLNWIIGDWLLAADSRWGEMYKEAMELTGRDYDFLTQRKFVSRAYDFLHRCKNLSWSHHREAALRAGDKKFEYLQIADRDHLSKNQMIALIESDKQLLLEPEPEEDNRPLFNDPELDAALEDESKSVCPECGQVYDGDACPDCNTSTFENNVPTIPLQPNRIDHVTLAMWQMMNKTERAELFTQPATSQFNRTNDNVEWALWTWNPVTGCLHNCPYCYARDIANRFYDHLPLEERFSPVFYPNRLLAPQSTKRPNLSQVTDPVQRMGLKNVFVCSMADLFGKWVPTEWIEAVLEQVKNNPQWNFLFLTKFPIRMAEFEYPPNVWLGTSVDHQWAVERAEKAFIKIKQSGFSGICWLSCEPMMERLTFTSLNMFDWVAIGGASKSTQTPEFRPPREWVNHLEEQADNAGCKVYEKTNLLERRREYPGF